MDNLDPGLWEVMMQLVRTIFTELNKLTNYMFKQEDLNLLSIIKKMEKSRT